MTSARRAAIGVLGIVLFVLSSAIVFAPVRTADTGMVLAFIPHGGAKRMVESVEPSGPAQQAGLRHGDVVDLGRMTLDQRLALYWSASPNDVQIPVDRAGRQFVVRLSLRAPPAHLPPWAIAMTILVNTVCLGLLFLILRDAADRREAHFLLGWILAELANNTYYLIFATTGMLAFIGAALTPITGGFLYYYIMRFVLAVPKRDSPYQAFFSSLIPYVIGLYFICDVALPSIANLVPAFDYGRGVDSEPMRLLWYGDILALLTIVAIIVDGLIRTEARRRAQLHWVASTVLLTILIEFTRAVFYLTTGSAPLVIDTVAYPLESIAVLGASYAVLRYRLIDLKLVVSRAAVFAVVSAILVAAFVVAEWGAARLAEKIFGSVPVSAIERYSGVFAALLAGLLARYVHAFVEKSLGKVFFRRQHRNEEDLKRFAQEADNALDSQALLAGAFDTLRRCIPASYVALIVRQGNGYRIVHASRPFERVNIEASWPGVLNRRDFIQPFVIDDAGDEFFHSTIFPMTVLGRLVAFIACGPKLDRTRYSDREVKVIADFAHRVGNAHAWLSGERRVPAKVR